MIVQGYYIDSTIQKFMLILMIISFGMAFYEFKRFWLLNKDTKTCEVKKLQNKEKMGEKIFFIRLVFILSIFVIVSLISETNSKIEFSPENVEKYNLCKDNIKCKYLLINFYKDGYISNYEMKEINKLNEEYKTKLFNDLYGVEKEYFENLKK